MNFIQYMSEHACKHNVTVTVMLRVSLFTRKQFK